MPDDKLLISENKTAENAAKLILNGRVNTESANVLQRRLEEAYRNYKHIVLNMQQVSFLSSGGIRVLLMYYKIANGSGGSFFIENPSENVKNVLGMVALDEMMLKK